MCVYTSRAMQGVGGGHTDMDHVFIAAKHPTMTVVQFLNYKERDMDKIVIAAGAATAARAEANRKAAAEAEEGMGCLLYTSPSPRD